MRQQLVVAAFCLIAVPSGRAADYPSRQITFIVPFAVGGPLDSIARTFAPRMSSLLGVPIVVENIAGAGGSLGVGRVVQASPDGYTVGVGNWSTHVLNGEIYKLNYNLISDLAPIVRLPGSPQVLVSRKDHPARNLAELTGWLKQNRATMGTAGSRRPRDVNPEFFEKRTRGRIMFCASRGVDRPER